MATELSLHVFNFTWEKFNIMGVFVFVHTALKHPFTIFAHSIRVSWWASNSQPETDMAMDMLAFGF